ncbi:MAG TPA: PAS domain S-box protein [Capsulimonadaceae bacterium]|jgi:PAS domain S-box-containing protein
MSSHQNDQPLAPRPNTVIDAASQFRANAGFGVGDELWPIAPDVQHTAADLIETNEMLTIASLRFEELFQSLPVICFSYDADGIVHEWNRECEAATGFTGSDVLQRRVWDTFYLPSEEQRIRDMVTAVFRGKSFEAVEIDLVRADRTTISVISSTFPLRDTNGDIVGAISANVDISKRIEAEQALRLSEERLRLALDVAQLGSWEWDLVSDMVNWSSIDAFLMGFPPTRLSVPSELLLMRIHPDDRPRVQSSMQFAREQQSIYEAEYRIIRPDGGVRWVISRGRFIYADTGEALRLIGTVLDITDRKDVEDRLRHAHELLEMRVDHRTAELARANRALQAEIVERNRAEGEIRLYADIVQNMQIGIHVYQLDDMENDDSLKLVAFNPSASKHANYIDESYVGRFIGDMFPNHKLYDLPHRYAEVVRSGQAYQADDLHYKHVNGTEYVFAIKAFPLPDRCVGVSFEDVTNRRAADEELRRVHHENRNILSSIGSVLICFDEKMDVTTWNSTAEQLFNIPAASVLGKQFAETGITWDWEPLVMGVYECMNTGQTVRLDDLKYTKRDGKDGFLGISVNPLRDDAGTVTGFLLLGTDITKRRLLESQLAQSQKLESIGNLAAGIAHEINTPIQYVGDNTRFLKDAFLDMQKLVEQCNELMATPESDLDVPTILQKLRAVVKAADVDYLVAEIPSAIQQSLEGVDRVAHIVRAMKEFSHPGKEEMTAVDLNRAIESTITVARNEWKYVADVVTDFQDGMVPVNCYPSAFNQVILNIIINAAHAISDVVEGSEHKGTITVATRQLDECAEITISDTGVGMPPEVISRIYDPFYTTKAVGRGTGQGLAISHSVIVDKHKGAIDVSSKVGVGTTFTIRLPLERKS